MLNHQNINSLTSNTKVHRTQNRYRPIHPQQQTDETQKKTH